MTQVSHVGGMIIQHYDFEVRDRIGPVYRGDTYFGFFSKQSLAQQVGIREAPLHPIAERPRRGASRPTRRSPTRCCG